MRMPTKKSNGTNGADFSGASELRQIRLNLDITNESFNDRFTLEQLVQIGRMLLKSEWDIYPDSWTQKQVQDALMGWPPHFSNDDEKPIYPGREGYPFPERFPAPNSPRRARKIPRAKKESA